MQRESAQKEKKKEMMQMDFLELNASHLKKKKKREKKSAVYWLAGKILSPVGRRYI